MKKAILSTLSLIILLPACGSMKVDRVKETEGVKGLRIQVPVPHDVVAVVHDAKGKRAVQVTSMSLPAKDEFYELGFKGGAFSSREINVTVHANGTLKEYSFDRKQKVSDALQGVADAAGTVTTALEELEPTTLNPVEVDNAQLQLDILNLMLKANLEAIQNGQPLPFPSLFDG